nr:phosphatidylinositol 3-kinase catalytic subunit type 3 isoform X2 [Onthophagus taurus]
MRALVDNPSLEFTGPYQPGLSELLVKCELFDQGYSIALPVWSTPKRFTTRYNWNEWIKLPLRFCDLPRTTLLAITICDCGTGGEAIAIGGTTIPLFSKYGLFRRGSIDLRVWRGRSADGNDPSVTPGKDINVSEEGKRLAKLKKKYQTGRISEITWLDRLTFRELEIINERDKRQSNCMYLLIEFPSTIDNDGTFYHVVYFEEEGSEVLQFKAQADIVTCPDYEINTENLIESKYHKLSRSHRSVHSDRDAKPNAILRDKLNQIVAYSSTVQLSNEEQDNVWRYRFYLSSQKKALTKFLKCINWGQSGEVKQALAMLDIWSPMDVEDALELLGPSFTHSAVRRYAISRLQEAPDEDLMLYLLQLVQALKYENFELIQEGYRRVSEQQQELSLNDDKESMLEKKDSKESNSTITNEPLLNRSASCTQGEISLGSRDFDSMQRAITVPEELMQKMKLTSESSNTDTLQSELKEQEVQDLASFLISRACKNSSLANYFYWYLLIECGDQENVEKKKEANLVRDTYVTVMKTFSQTLARGSPEMQTRRDFLNRQQKFMDKLVKLIKKVSSENVSRKKKTERLQQLLADSDSLKINWTNFDPFPFPLDPEVQIKGILPEKASLFKSAFMPSKLHFVTTKNTEYVAIFKHGDDLRQDQLILQMITLMDKLLRKENLDVKLTPYKVLAISTKNGFVQFIDSYTIAEIVSTDHTILNFFKKHHPQENSPNGVAPEIMDNYIRSCAGYCVITYLLGVGDRHLDNLLITTRGELFHIDFGYILGRDPKPLPPPMKLSREMLDAMGGMQSEYFQQFKKLCFTSFLHLRRHGNLMLNLFSLMVDASVPDIALEPDKAVKKIEEKLQLQRSDEEAVQLLKDMIDESASAVVDVFVEQLHRIAQYWRK